MTFYLLLSGEISMTDKNLLPPKMKYFKVAVSN